MPALCLPCELDMNQESSERNGFLSRGIGVGNCSWARAYQDSRGYRVTLPPRWQAETSENGAIRVLGPEQEKIQIYPYYGDRAYDSELAAQLLFAERSNVFK